MIFASYHSLCSYSFSLASYREVIVILCDLTILVLTIKPPWHNSVQISACFSDNFRASYMSYRFHFVTSNISQPFSASLFLALLPSLFRLAVLLSTFPVSSFFIHPFLSHQLSCPPPSPRQFNSVYTSHTKLVHIIT